MSGTQDNPPTAVKLKRVWEIEENMLDKEEQQIMGTFLFTLHVWEKFLYAYSQ